MFHFRPGCLRSDVVNPLRNPCLQFRSICSQATVYNIFITPQPEVTKIEVWWWSKPYCRTMMDMSIISEMPLEQLPDFALCGEALVGMNWLRKTLISFSFHSTGNKTRRIHHLEKHLPCCTRCRQPAPHSYHRGIHQYCLSREWIFLCPCPAI